jgi:5-methylcytosine-specific restriction endonuclease McrA
MGEPLAYARLKKKSWRNISTKRRRRATPIPVRQDLRERLSEAQGHRCCYCLADIRVGATLEHIWPISKAGRTNYDNCVAACYACNMERGNGQIWDQYRRVRAIRWANRLASKFLLQAPAGCGSPTPIPKGETE